MIDVAPGRLGEQRHELKFLHILEAKFSSDVIAERFERAGDLELVKEQVRLVKAQDLDHLPINDISEPNFPVEPLWEHQDEVGDSLS